MEITPLQTSPIDPAAALFAAVFRRQRQNAPILPEQYEDPAWAAGRLREMLAYSAGVAAVEDGRLAGYLGWWIADDFRDTGRRGAYVPLWGHAVDAGADERRARRITRALYAAASQAWYEAGCQVHAVTRPADDPLVHAFWFWSGFGALVIDAVRPAQPLYLPAPSGFTIRKAGPEDARTLAALENEHWQHYGRPPVLMTYNHASDAEACARLLADPANSFWLAIDGDQAVAYLRFEPASDGAAEVVSDSSSIACTGAYTRPAYRGRGAAAALLDAALRRFQQQGLRRCTVDFETINPEASAFWLRFFTPVCLSMTRIPEKAPAGEQARSTPGLPEPGRAQIVG